MKQLHSNNFALFYSSVLFIFVGCQNSQTNSQDHCDGTNVITYPVTIPNIDATAPIAELGFAGGPDGNISSNSSSDIVFTINLNTSLLFSAQGIDNESGIKTIGIYVESTKWIDHGDGTGSVEGPALLGGPDVENIDHNSSYNPGTKACNARNVFKTYSFNSIIGGASQCKIRMWAVTENSLGTKVISKAVEFNYQKI